MLLAGLKATKTTTEEFVELSTRRNQNKQNRVVVHPYLKPKTLLESGMARKQLHVNILLMSQFRSKFVKDS